MFTWCGGTIACLSTILIYETQIGPFLRNIFAAYSVMRETFTQVDSSISVQLVTGLLQVRYEKPRGGSRGAMTRSLSGR
jgi:hypothetical protein